MKKSTILTFATAAAVLATSAGTFAAWDKITDTKDTTLTYANPVTVTEAITPPAETSYTLGGAAPATEVSVTFTVDDKDTRASALKVVPSVKQGNTDLVENGKVTVAVKEGETELTDNKDATITASNEYTVVVTPNDTATFADLNNATLSVTGTLE